MGVTKGIGWTHSKLKVELEVETVGNVGKAGKLQTWEMGKLGKSDSEFLRTSHFSTLPILK